jgi:GT2 family glycosyltransferase
MQWIQKTLACIPEKYHVIVVDNNSSDNTVNFIENHYKTISLFPQKKNLGFGAGNNLGMSYAIKQGADYIFLLNQDAYLETDTIDNLIKAHKLNTDYGILSPVHLNGSGEKLDWNFSTYLETGALEIVQDTIVSNKRNNKIHNVPFVNAAAWLLPIKTINTIGGFDPIFFHYGEDNNYCQRVLYHGLKVGVVTNAYIQHDRNNKGLTPNITSEEALKKREKQLKVNWADVNKNSFFEISQRKQKLFKKLFYSLIKFNFNDVKYRWAEIHLINAIIPEIKKSKQKNRIKGKHYINE